MNDTQINSQKTMILTQELAMDHISPESQNATVLIIDDTSNDLLLLSTILRGNGYNVRFVPEGHLALRSATTTPPDIILLDIMMPNMDGYAVCEALKANEITRDIPVIFISALDGVMDKLKGFALGGVDYITKPFHTQEVLARVAIHLSLRQMHQQLEQQNIRLQQEIGERRKIEEALRKANTRLAQLATTQEQVVVSRERNSMARELHDTLAYTLSGIAVQLETIRSLWNENLDQAYRVLEQTQTMAQSSLTEVRGALKSLRLNPLEDMGLVLAIHQLAQSVAQRSGLELTFQDNIQIESLPLEVEQSIYRIAQEALTNVERHAQASSLTVSLQQEGDYLHLTIEDNGCGFVVSGRLPEHTFGLRGMYERAELIGGHFSVASSPKRGTTISLTVTLEG